MKDFTSTFTVTQTPHEVFSAINNIQAWWIDEIEGSSQKLNDEFSVRFGSIHYSKQKLVEFIPDSRVVWLVTDSRLNFLKQKDEWTNTKIIFEITRKGNKTEIRFTHVGLLPQIECYGDCSGAWEDYIQNSLKKLITTGKGEPTEKRKIK